jgi:hypothetical protein
MLKICMRLDWNMMNNFIHWANSNATRYHVKCLNQFQFESSLNFKGVETFGENLVNSLKIYLDLIFTNVNLVGHTCMQEIEVSIQMSIWLYLKIKKRL